MKILVTGATGYIGSRLIAHLIHQGHEVYALVRYPHRLQLHPELKQRLHILIGDLKNRPSLSFPSEIEAAYFLVHGMTQKSSTLKNDEELMTENFLDALKPTQTKQIIYLSGLIPKESLSPHLSSRKRVEELIRKSGHPYTILRAGIIIGAGSASFEIIRDLCEKLPVMIAPKWVNQQCQPISIFDVLYYLTSTLNNSECINQAFDIGGPEILTYKEILLGYAEFRKLKRHIFVVPVLSPKLSAYWLIFITSVNYYLAQSLISSVKNKCICQDFLIQRILPHNCLTYREALARAFNKIEQNAVVSTWKDTFLYGGLSPNLEKYIEVPTHGTYAITYKSPLEADKKMIQKTVWKIGGKTGWLYWNWAWKIRGKIDKFLGGVGLNRGRKNPYDIQPGDVIDCWRVIKADPKSFNLLLYAEMKMPGEAWLNIFTKNNELVIQASFRPKGLFGRIYWWVLYIFHIPLLRGLSHQIMKRANS